MLLGQRACGKTLLTITFNYGDLKIKTSYLIAALVTLPLSLAQAWAEDTQPYDKDKKPTGAMTDQNKTPMAASMDKDKQTGMTQEKMLLMHEQMHKIIDAKTPQEREQLMQAHAKMMQDMKVSQENTGRDAKRSKTDGASMMDDGGNTNARGTQKGG